MPVDDIITRWTQIGVSGLRRDLRVLGADMDTFEGKAARMEHTADHFLGWGTGIAAAVGMVGAASLSAAGKLETMQIGFESVLKSKAKADQLMTGIQKFSLVSPFDFSATAKSAQQLLAMGIAGEQIIPILHGVGEAAAAAGTGTYGFQRALFAIGEINTLGTVQARQLRMLAQAGIPVFKILQEQLHLTDKQMENIGKQHIKASVAIPALMKGFDQTYGDALERQSNTLVGATAHFKTAAFMLDASIGKTIRPEATQILKTLTAAELAANDFLKSHPRAAALALDIGTVTAAALLSAGAFLKLKSMLPERTAVDFTKGILGAHSDWSPSIARVMTYKAAVQAAKEEEKAAAEATAATIYGPSSKWTNAAAGAAYYKIALREQAVAAREAAKAAKEAAAGKDVLEAATVRDTTAERVKTGVAIREAGAIAGTGRAAKAAAQQVAAMTNEEVMSAMAAKQAAASQTIHIASMRQLLAIQAGATPAEMLALQGFSNKSFSEMYALPEMAATESAQAYLAQKMAEKEAAWAKLIAFNARGIAQYPQFYGKHDVFNAWYESQEIQDELVAAHVGERIARQNAQAARIRMLSLPSPSGAIPMGTDYWNLTGTPFPTNLKVLPSGGITAGPAYSWPGGIPTGEVYSGSPGIPIPETKALPPGYADFMSRQSVNPVVQTGEDLMGWKAWEAAANARRGDKAIADAAAAVVASVKADAAGDVVKSVKIVGFSDISAYISGLASGASGNLGKAGGSVTAIQAAILAKLGLGGAVVSPLIGLGLGALGAQGMYSDEKAIGGHAGADAAFAGVAEAAIAMFVPGGAIAVAFTEGIRHLVDSSGPEEDPGINKGWLGDIDPDLGDTPEQKAAKAAKDYNKWNPAHSIELDSRAKRMNELEGRATHAKDIATGMISPLSFGSLTGFARGPNGEWHTQSEAEREWYQQYRYLLGMSQIEQRKIKALRSAHPAANLAGNLSDFNFKHAAMPTIVPGPMSYDTFSHRDSSHKIILHSDHTVHLSGTPADHRSKRNQYRDSSTLRNLS